LCSIWSVRIDVHQHIWTEPLLDGLAARDTLPLVRRDDGLTVLHSAAEQPYVINVASEAPARRSRLVRADGLDLALVAISSPVGIESLPRESALELIGAHVEGVTALPGEFAAWGPVALDGADPDDVDTRAGPDRLELAGPLLERAAARHVPVFVHPGGVPGHRCAEASFGEPLWWRAMTDYVSQMQAAWLTFASFGRREHPDLAIVFAILAGCAPLLSERLAIRGGPAVELRDPLTFYEMSSYGPGAVEMMARRVGECQLLYGSDRPVVEPEPTGREALLRANADRLFESISAPALS
jgi:hypothetical protein